MIVKTKIINPTDKKQRYSWIPKHGAFIAAKSEMVIDGDIYTLADKIVKNRKCIDADIESGRVRVVMITDIDVERPEDQVEQPEPEQVPRNDKKPTKAESPKTMEKIPLPKKKEPKDDLEEFNILGEGLVEGSIEDGKPPAVDAFTGEEVEDPRPKAEDVSDYLWNGDAEEDDIESEDEEVEAELTKTELKQKLKKDLIAIADDLGCIDIPSTKSEIIDWIIENQ